MSLSPEKIKNIVEAALMAAGQPCSIDRLLSLFIDEYQPTTEELKQALDTLAEECAGRGVELKEVSSGFRFQARQDYAQWVARLWEEKPARYSRAMLETLALIAYRQPITRGDIEDIRGVTVSSNIMKTLLERDWVKVVGYRDVPGKPAMYATTRQFLDYFNLKSLSDLPTLAEIRDIDSINAELDLGGGEPANDASREESAKQLEMSSDDIAMQEAQQADAGEEVPEEAPADDTVVAMASVAEHAAEAEAETPAKPNTEEE
jgi:segregation and condensation protein B